MQGPKWPLFYSHIDPVWLLLIIGTGSTLGRAPRIKETLPDFREWCRITPHSRVFRGLTGYQRDPRDRGVAPFFFRRWRRKWYELEISVMFDAHNI